MINKKMPYKCEAILLSPDKPGKYWSIFSKSLVLKEELISYPNTPLGSAFMGFNTGLW